MKELKKENYKPTDSMKNAAQKGLNFRKEYKRGGTAIGIARARDIVNGKSLPIETVARMVSFFARHIHDREAQGWNSGEEGYPSNGLIADLLWGGRPGEKWVNSIWKKYKDNKKNLKNLERFFDEESSEELIKSILLSCEK